MKKLSLRNIVLSLLSIGIIFGAVNLFLAHTGAESLPNTGAPAGFSLTKVADGLYAPVAAEFAPDGRIFVAEKGGAVRIVKAGAVLPEPFYTVPNVNDYVDRGLLGLAVDPDFASNHYIYLLYTHDNNPSNVAGPKTARLLRVTAQGDKAVAGSEQILLGTNVGNSAQTSCYDFPASSDCLPADGLSHAPGTVKFGPDKTIYVTTGDAAGYDDVDTKALYAQDIDYLAGKILRINRDGTAPADNPFYNGNPNANRSKVYAYGVRNAFRLSIRPADGQIMVGDVGWNTWEEVNAVPKGGNLGWPCYEARDQQNGTGAPGIGAYKDQAFCKQLYANPPANLVWPVHFYPHPPSSAVVSGMFYDGTNYPAEYKGRFFYGDYARDQIYMMDLDQNNQMVTGSHKTFASNAGGPVNFFTGPNGDIYYLAIMMGGIYHIDYSTSNRAPNAVISSDKTFGAAPLTVKFSSSGSSDPENDALTYAWDFGDGTPVNTEASPQHTFAADGTYTVSLTVSDAFNNTNTKTLKIYSGQTAPEITINSPTDMLVANPEQVINLNGSAVDGRDGVLPASALKWQITIHHCPLDSCHIHNVQTITGNTGTFSFPHHDGPFYVQLTLSATNSTGLTSSKYVSIYPAGQAITHAMQFDGINDYADTAGTQDFRLQTMTVEAMIKTLSTDDWGSEVLSMGNNWSLRVMPNGNIQYSFWNGSGWQNLIANINVKDGLWHHIAATKTASGVKIYDNGAVVAQNENPSPIAYVYGNTFVVGRHGDADDHFNFNGSIDEVRIWSAPRTDAQIQQYRTTTLPAGQANLVAYYKAEEGNGLIAADSGTTASHPLNLMNGTAWTAGAPLSDPVVVPAPVYTPITDLKDNFDGTTIDGAKWGAFAAAGQVKQNNTLEITPNSSASGYFGVVSKQKYELKENALYVEVPQRTTAGTTAETQMIVELDGANNISIGATGNSLLLRHRVAGANSDTYMPYDAVAMRWWKIREAAGTLYLETSPDGSNWTTRRTVTKAFALNNLSVVLQAGTWQAVATPGTATFDNLNLQAPATPPPTQPGNAMGLNGSSTSQAIVGGSNHRHYTSQALTLEAWTKVTATGIWGGELVSNGNNYGVRILPDGNIRFFIYVGNASGTMTWRNYETTGINIKDGQWHHIAASKDAATANIYVDGALVKSFASTDPIVYTLGPNFVVGRHGDGDNNFNLAGAVDELRVWSIARTSTEIAASYDKAITAVVPGLAATWHFDGSDLTTLGKNSVDDHDMVLGAGVSVQTGIVK